ncbi:MAG: N-acetylmuramoyl-L-alanine amidase [Gemmatimonadaceae bacterium]|nr:N-acetylmuramoyl-L-alanine amidase [Gemmatimonadaceae bacterium]
MQHKRQVAVIAGLMLITACSDGPRKVAGPPSCAAIPGVAAGPTAAVVPLGSPYDAAFDAASREFGIPSGILRAIGFVETRWQMVAGVPEFEGHPATSGVMALGGIRLDEAARLTGLAAGRVRDEPESNIRAAAALLRHHATALGISGEDAAWTPAIAAFSGIALPEGREAYAREVSAVLAGRRSQPSVSASAFAVDDPCATPPPPPTTDHLGALWRTSPNFNQRMAGDGGRVQMVIIHSCEGSYIGCWSWLANRESQVSAHYVVREDGAEVTQLVREWARAWHIGAIYDSTLNAASAGHLHGVQSNHFTIGVEHAGYASQVAWPAAQLDASARLVCGAAKRWGIPRNRVYIVAHGQLQPWNRTDPGPHWPWDDYLARIDQHCA